MITDKLNIDGHTYAVRSAMRDDVPAIVSLLADDMLGRQRETANTDLTSYFTAFDRIASHPNQELLVVEQDGSIVGTLDLTVLASMSRQGTLRMQVEAVRVASSERGTGLGTVIFEWVIDYARHAGCGLLQLTTDRTRADAHRFYDRLGFVPSHIGYKLDLRDNT